MAFPAAAGMKSPGAAAMARAAQDSRLDPMVARMLVQQSSAAGTAQADASATSSSHEISLLVRGDIRSSDLSALGARVQTEAGSVTTVLAPLSSLPALLGVAGVEAIDAPRQLQPLLNVSAMDIDAPQIWGGNAPNYTGATGRGVIIGIIDTGLDLSNADFRTATNQTRVKYVWDQTAFGSGPGTFGYGLESTEAQINAGTCNEVDSDGHGTHIAGIAASNGRKTSGTYPMYRYVGIAPEADLVIVKSYLLENEIIDGANYIFQKATSLGKDCIVLIAAGCNRGAHDGTYSLDVALSALTGPGHIIVAAAGNQGGQALHSQVNLASGATGTINFSVPTYTPSTSVTEFLDVEGWHNASAVFSARLTSPGGFTTGWIAPGAQSPNIETTDGLLILRNDITTNSKGAKQIRVLIGETSTGVSPKVGSWKLELQRQTSATTGLFDAWISDWRFGSGNVSPVFTSQVNYTELIDSPASADSVISVGAYTTKNEWINSSGQTSFFSDLPVVNDIASFSSPGPRRDGVQRPDLTAPGQGVASSLSATAASMISNTRKVDDGVHWIYRGTSAAAAHTAGAIALLLQQTPHMAPAAARKSVTQRAQRDSYTGAVPNGIWGSGKLDLIASTAAVGDGSSGSFELAAVRPNPTRGSAAFDFSVSSTDLAGAAPVLRVMDLSGREVAVLRGQRSTGPQRLVWNGLTSGGRAAPAGVYLGRLEVGTRWAARKFVRLQ